MPGERFIRTLVWRCTYLDPASGASPSRKDTEGSRLNSRFRISFKL